MRRVMIPAVLANQERPLQRFHEPVGAELRQWFESPESGGSFA